MIILPEPDGTSSWNTSAKFWLTPRNVRRIAFDVLTEVKPKIYEEVSR